MRTLLVLASCLLPVVAAATGSPWIFGAVFLLCQLADRRCATKGVEKRLGEAGLTGPVRFVLRAEAFPVLLALTGAPAALAAGYALLPVAAA
ncbi:hypothetical protein, partial [Actinocorallia lasiicapitis]